MNPSQLLLYALLIVLLYLIYTYVIRGSSHKLSSLLSAGTPYIVSQDSIAAMNGSESIFNYTVSIWIYVENWEINQTGKKPILSIPNALDLYLGGTDNTLTADVYKFKDASIKTSTTAESFDNLLLPSEPAPIESLTSMDIAAKKKTKESMKLVNEGFVTKVSTSATTKSASREPFTTTGLMSVGDNVEVDFKATVPAIPLQSWTNITVGIHDKAIDIYINGKLTQSNLFPFVPGPVNREITITPSPGFIGWTSNFQYFPYNLSPNQVENIYKAGYTGSPESILSLLGKYSLRVVFVDNSQKQ